MTDRIDNELSMIFRCSYFDDAIACDKPATVLESDGELHCDEHADIVCWLCGISDYTEKRILCTRPATRFCWGAYDDLVDVCDVHARWNPYMTADCRCPDCSKLADHRAPCDWRGEDEDW